MSENQIGVSEMSSHRPRRWRYLIDIIALVAVTLLLDAVLGALVHEPINWKTGFVLDAIGIGLAAIVFIAIYFSEKAGFRRDLSKFKDVQGNPELALLGVLYALIGAGFYEEFTFRGFLMQGLAMLFGGNRGAWLAACLLQGALFGVAHAYQNPLGIAITGTLGVLMGLIVLASGRNLWLVIIGHGLYDASRFVLFYFQGQPTG